MVSSKHGARLSERDLYALNEAAAQLADAAATIKRANPAWAAAVIQLIALAQSTCIRLRDKGAATFARYLQKHGLPTPQDAPETPAAAETPPDAPIAPQGEEER